MKKLILLLSALCLFAVGCQSDNTTDNAVSVGDGTTTLAVSLSQTRTSLGGKVGETYSVYWSEGDKIVVDGVLSEVVKINADNKASATFSVKGTINPPYNITYPYCASTTAEQSVVEFQAEQTYTEGSFAQGSMPMCGYMASATNSVTLNHLACVLRFPVKAKFEGTVLEKIVVTSTEKIAGEFNVNCQAVKISATEGCGNNIIYTLPTNQTLSTTAESVFHIVLPAVNVGSCTIEFIETSGEKMVATWTPNKVLTKGSVREFKTVTYEPKAKSSLQPLVVEEDEFVIFYDKVYGYVRYSDGTPIAGVAMSDGFQVVTTDSNGYYEMESVTPETWYIYCSLPNDVVVPIDDLGRPCFFQKYPASSPQYDFTFDKLPNGPEEEFALFAIADPQPGSMASVERFRAQASPEMKNYSKKINIPCYGIVLGDIISNVYGDEAYLFEHIQQALSAKNTGIPVFAVYGNHDNCDFNEKNPIFADERNSTFNLKIQRAFEDTFGPANYSFNRGDTHIISLRNSQYKYNYTPSGDYVSTGFTVAQYEWVQQDLAQVPKDKMVILCVHIPLDNKTGENIQNVLTLLDQYSEAHVFSGHMHYRTCYDHVAKQTGHKVFEQSWSSAGAVSNSDGTNIACDGAPTGYGVVTIKNGHMIKSIHKGYAYGMNDPDYQIRLHRGGDITGAAIPEGDANKNGTKGYYQFPYDSNTILANVFSSDPWGWTVEVWNYDEATGQRTTKIGNMTSLSGYKTIPSFEELIGSFTYEDPKRPAATVTDSGRDFWTIGVLLGHLGKSITSRYHRCLTLWKYTLSDADANAKIMVVARDRWGNEFTETEFQVGTDVGYAIYDPALNPVAE